VNEDLESITQVRRERDRLPDHAPEPQRGKERHYRRRRQPPEKHSQRGWLILATVQVPGELALSIEKEILDWRRGELALPFTPASRRCPTADGPRRSTPPRPAWRQRSSGSRISRPRQTDPGSGAVCARPLRGLVGGTQAVAVQADSAGDHLIEPGEAGIVPLSPVRLGRLLRCLLCLGGLLFIPILDADQHQKLHQFLRFLRPVRAGCLVPAVTVL
jgi:hypothetical protein